MDGQLLAYFLESTMRSSLPSLAIISRQKIKLYADSSKMTIECYLSNLYETSR